MAITQITDHVDVALARLAQQLKDKTNLEALLSGLAGPTQAMEDAWWQLLTERSVDTAVGAQLDDIGAIVGQARGGLVDDDYRRYVRARISANRSRGLVSDILKVAGLIINNVAVVLRLEEQYPATVVLRISGITVDDALAQILTSSFLRDVASAGVRMLVEYSTIPDNEILYLDIDNLDEEKFLPAIE